MSGGGEQNALYQWLSLPFGYFYNFFDALYDMAAQNSLSATVCATSLFTVYLYINRNTYKKRAKNWIANKMKTVLGRIFVRAVNSKIEQEIKMQHNKEELINATVDEFFMMEPNNNNNNNNIDYFPHHLSSNYKYYNTLHTIAYATWKPISVVGHILSGIVTWSTNTLWSSSSQHHNTNARNIISIGNSSPQSISVREINSNTMQYNGLMRYCETTLRLCLTTEGFDVFIADILETVRDPLSRALEKFLLDIYLQVNEQQQQHGENTQLQEDFINVSKITDHILYKCIENGIIVIPEHDLDAMSNMLDMYQSASTHDKVSIIHTLVQMIQRHCRQVIIAPNTYNNGNNNPDKEMNFNNAHDTTMSLYQSSRTIRVLMDIVMSQIDYLDLVCQYKTSQSDMNDPSAIDNDTVESQYQDVFYNNNVENMNPKYSFGDTTTTRHRHNAQQYPFLNAPVEDDSTPPPPPQQLDESKEDIEESRVLKEYDISGDLMLRYFDVVSGILSRVEHYYRKFHILPRVESKHDDNDDDIQYADIYHFYTHSDKENQQLPDHTVRRPPPFNPNFYNDVEGNSKSKSQENKEDDDERETIKTCLSAL